MTQWIFKIIYLPITLALLGVAIIVLIHMLSEVGWDVPLRWLVVIGAMAAAADYFVNK